MSGMSKVFMANTVDNTSLIKGLITNGTLLRFGTGGKFLGETPLAYNISGVSQIDVISILKQGDTIEVAFNIQEVFTKHSTSKDLINLVTEFNKFSGIVFAGKRDGAVDSLTFTQYIYGFAQGVLTLQKLLEVL